MIEIETATLVFVIFMLLMGAITQVLVPLYQGRRLFPLFRRTADLEWEMTVANEELALVEQEKELARRRAILEKKKGNVKKESSNANAG